MISRLTNHYGATFNQVMLRIKDPARSIPFYTQHFNMTVAQELHFPSAQFSLYFLVQLREGQAAPEPGTEAARDFLKAGDYGCCLELTHNHGTEADAGFAYHNGNTEPRGFGHVGFVVDDVYAKCAELEQAGVDFQKKPDDGNMKGLAFALDPDNYWVEVIRRTGPGPFPAGTAQFSQAMLRVKDGRAEVEWYRNVCGLDLVAELHFEQWNFSLYFVGSLTEEQRASLPDPSDHEANFRFINSFDGQLLELTHNHGTETDDAFVTNHGNDAEMGRGFGHVAIMVDDVYAYCELAEAAGVRFQKTPLGGRMKGLAFMLSPSGYWVEVVSRQTPELLQAAPFKPLRARRPFPMDVTLTHIPVDQEACSGPQTVTTGELLAGKKALLINVPGAFTPGCSQRHLPGLVEHAAALRAEHGFEVLACVATNDAFAMHRWGRDQGVAGAVDYMLSDGSGRLQRALGTVTDLHAKGMGTRGRRWAMAVDEAGVVTHVALDNDAYWETFLPLLAAGPQGVGEAHDVEAALAAGRALLEHEAVPEVPAAAAGTPFPAVTLTHIPVDQEACTGPQPVVTTELFAGKRVLLTSAPGAFTPTCSERHLPGIVSSAAALRAEHSLDLIVACSVGDAFLMHAWGRSLSVAGAIDYMLADGSGELHRALGLALDLTANNMGVRGQRFSAVIADNVVEQVWVGEASMRPSSSSA